jgi:transposase
MLSLRLIKGSSMATHTGLKTLDMNKFIKKKVFIGIDISKDYLDLALLREDSYGRFDDKKAANSFQGFDQIEDWLVKKKIEFSECVFCMEHTGTHGLLLFAWLGQMGFDYVVEPALKIKRCLGITRGKSDKLDARRIADYAYTYKAKLEPFCLPSTVLLQIKQLLTYRDQLTKMNTSFKNSLKSHDQYKRVSGLQSISEEIKSQIRDLEIRIKNVEEQIIELIRSDETIKKNYELATSVKGIGFVIATFMLVTTNNFTGFEDGRKYACYSGIAPFEHTSGSSIKGQTKVSNLANKRVKTILSNGANSACQWDPELKAYYNRKIAEGKEHKLIINTISYKLVTRVFAVVKRQTPYVKIYAQNFA